MNTDVNKLKQDMLATDIAPWRKRGLFAVILLLSLFPFALSCAPLRPTLVRVYGNFAIFWV